MQQKPTLPQLKAAIQTLDVAHRNIKSKLDAIREAEKKPPRRRWQSAIGAILLFGIAVMSLIPVIDEIGIFAALWLTAVATAFGAWAPWGATGGPRALKAHKKDIAKRKEECLREIREIQERRPDGWITRFSPLALCFERPENQETHLGRLLAWTNPDNIPSAADYADEILALKGAAQAAVKKIKIQQLLQSNPVSNFPGNNG